MRAGASDSQMLLDAQVLRLTRVENQQHLGMFGAWISPVMGQRGIEQQIVTRPQLILSAFHSILNEPLETIRPFNTRMLDGICARASAWFQRDQERGTGMISQVSGKVLYCHPRAPTLNSVHGPDKNEISGGLSCLKESLDRYSEAGCEALQGIHARRANTALDQADRIGRYLGNLGEGAQGKAALLPQVSEFRSNVKSILHVPALCRDLHAL